MTVPTNYSQFEKYLSNKMTEKEAVDFEISCASQPDKNEEFKLYQLLRTTARYIRRNQIRNYLKINASSKLSGNIWGNTWTKISAIFIIIIGLLIFYIEYYKKVIQKEENTIININTEE